MQKWFKLKTKGKFPSTTTTTIIISNKKSRCNSRARANPLIRGEIDRKKERKKKGIPFFCKVLVVYHVATLNSKYFRPVCLLLHPRFSPICVYAIAIQSACINMTRIALLLYYTVPSSSSSSIGISDCINTV